jgi:hypothetical protein
MRDASRRFLLLIAAAAIAACSKPAPENNVAIDINNAAPGDIEELPPDESVDTSSNELVNGADNADVNADINAPENAY